MNSFNKTEAAVFPMQAMLPSDFAFFLELLTTTQNIFGG